MTAVVDRARSMKLTWLDLPHQVRSSVEAALGVSVVKALNQPGGFSSGMATQLLLADGRRAFAKGVPVDHPLAGTYRAEADISARLPAAAPSPRLLHCVENRWIVLLFDGMDGHQPDLRPGSPDLAAVLAAVTGATRTLTPCPLADAPDVVDDLGPLLRGWSSLLSAAVPRDLDPWARAHLESLAALETAWLPWAGGKTLLHNDLRASNLIRRFSDGRVVITNWCYPSRGAAWLDAVSLVPQLILAGHRPADAERLILGRPALTGVPGWAITGFATALAGHWELSGRLPEPQGSVGLRAYQFKAAEAALTWVAHRTHW